MLKENLHIIFMGTPAFAVPSLQILVEKGYAIIAVVTAPDKPQGRGKKVLPSPVKQCALEYNIPVLQPTNLKNPAFIEELRAYQADLQVVVAFRMLPEVVWSMPPKGTFNLHASLLPQYRGAAPINWAIINGETETGVTTFMLRHEIDAGNIIFQEKEPIYSDDNAGILYERLMHKGGHLVLKTANAIASDSFTPTPQSETDKDLKPAPKIHRETCEINWNQPAEQVRNFIRGLSPYPAAWTRIKTQAGDKNCKIYTVSHTGIQNDNLKAGETKTDNKSYIHIQTKDFLLAVEELQLEGKKRLSVQEFLRGNTL